jgi:hypothetical protein
MRGGWSTLALLVVLAGLGGYIYYDSNRDPSSVSSGLEKAFPNAKSEQIEEITVRNDAGVTTTLKRDGSDWKISAPIDAKASSSDAVSIAGAVSGLELTRVVDENPTNLGEFGLEKPRIQIDFKGKDVPEGHLYIGEKSPTGAGVYARKNDDKRVFLIAAYHESTFNRSTFDLRDKALVVVPRAKIQNVEISNAGKPVVLTKLTKGEKGETTEWRVSKPIDARADYSASEALVGRLESAQMKSIASESVAFGDLKQYGLDNPAVRVTINAEGSQPLVVEFGSSAGPDGVYARDAAKSVVATVDKSLADDFKKSLDDFRRKDVFDFRAFNADRAELSWSGKTMVIERVKTEGDKPDVWKRVSPNEKELDKGKVETLLSGLADVRATSFRDAKTGTGLDAPTLSVSMKYDQGRSEERATFGKVGNDAFASRPDDAGAMVIEVEKLNEAITRLDELVQ